MIGTDRDLITIEWDKPKSDGGSTITSYTIELCCLTELDFTEAGKVASDTTCFTAQGLKEGQKYMVRVRAENAAGLSDSAAELSKPAVPRLPFGESICDSISS